MDYNERFEKYKDFTLYQKVYHVSLGPQRITGFPSDTFEKQIWNGQECITSDKWVYTGNDRGDYLDDIYLVRVEDLKIVDYYQKDPWKPIFK